MINHNGAITVAPILAIPRLKAKPKSRCEGAFPGEFVVVVDRVQLVVLVSDIQQSGAQFGASIPETIASPEVPLQYVIVRWLRCAIVGLFGPDTFHAREESGRMLHAGK